MASGLECGSVTHGKGARPVARVAIIYHDALTTGGLPTNINPETVLPGQYGTITALLCEACLQSAEITNRHAATVIRTIALT